MDRPEWVPSEEELKAELCNAREIDWPAEAAKEANRREKWMINVTDEYGEYMQGLSKDGRNFPEIPLRYMDAPADWMGKSLEAILNQIQSSPEEYQGYITGMLNRYLTACFKRLGGKWPSDIWDGSGNPYSTRICYDFCCPEWVGDDDLLRKIIVLQKLQAMISERVGQDDSAEQAGEPAADRGGVLGITVQTNDLSAESRCLQFIEKRHKLAAPDDQLLYLPLKGGRRPDGAKTKTGYIAKLYDDFKKESPVLVALSVFEQAFKTYKRQLNEKKNR